MNLGSFFSLLAKMPETLLTFLMPRRSEEEQILSGSPRDAILLFPRNIAPPRGNDVFFAVSYRHPLSRALIRLFKYQNHPHALEICVLLLSDFLLEEIADHSPFWGKEKVLIVPVPMSEREKRERGWNPAANLAERLAKDEALRGSAEYADLLSKMRETAKQTTLKNQKERLKNVEGTFLAKDVSKVRGRRIILIDDVTTTGATFLEGRRALLHAGAREVLCLAVAG